MAVSKGNHSHIAAIQQLAERTWYDTYSRLISTEQIRYMLDLFYADELLQSQLQDPQHYFLVWTEGNELLAYAHGLAMPGKMKLSKLYCRPDQQGKGLGARLLQALESEARQAGFTMLELCVNRGNPAQFFYEKQGFEIVGEADFPVGPYFMNDYIMQKKLD